jgi:hypothetical protein
MSDLDQPESKSIIVGSSNLHLSMNTRDSSKEGGVFRSSKSVLIDTSQDNTPGADLITREDGYNLGMGRNSKDLNLSGEMESPEGQGGRPAGIQRNRMSGKRVNK